MNEDKIQALTEVLSKVLTCMEKIELRLQAVEDEQKVSEGLERLIEQSLTKDDYGNEL